MGGYEKFYTGGDYGFESKYDDFLQTEYRTPTSNISLATNPFTANQIQEVASKLDTGAKALEVNMAFADAQHGSPAESIPEQHLEEINRLKKLVGADFTVHGALIEPTGVTKRGWDPTDRQQAERQMWLSLQRAHKLGPDGNIVVTFHTSNGLPEPETILIDEDTGQEKHTDMIIVDERNGNLNQLSSKTHYFPGQPTTLMDELKNLNKEQWNKQLQQTNFHAFAGAQEIERALKEPIIHESGDKKSKLEDSKILEYYNKYGTDEYKKEMALLGEDAGMVEERMKVIAHGNSYLRDAYGDLKNLFDTAYSSAERTMKIGTPAEKKLAQEDKKRLDEFKEKLEPKVSYIEKPEKVDDLAKEIVNGITLLTSISTPQVYRPLKDFAIDQASETFSNLAVNAYDEFAYKKAKNTAPIISIENPPAGSGISRAEDMKLLIDRSREKFVEKAKKDFGLSESEAKKQAEKLIGATWDVGHINMIKKFGYTDDTIIEDTKKIAPYVKNVHLSDNFGMEHTELPMGMGNVPTKRHMDILDKYAKQAKKVIEAGNWYQHFKTTPFGETLSAFGSPIYSMQMAPAWNQVYGKTNSGYFSGYGLNPEVHHSIYGAGFSGLPVELGGQITGRSRFTGTASE